MATPRFYPTQWIVFHLHSPLSAPSWIAPEQPQHDDFEACTDWVADQFHHDSEIAGDRLRIVAIDLTTFSAADVTSPALRAMARRYADGADSADDVPHWLIDYAPAWVREAHDAEQVRDMYRGAAE